jgi:transposase
VLRSLPDQEENGKLAILEKEVPIRITGKEVKYYEDFGYTIPKKLTKNGLVKYDLREPFIVQTKDLLKNSHVKVTKVCDICEKHITNQPYGYIVNSRNKTDGKDRCKDCSYQYKAEKRRNNVTYEKSIEYFALHHGTHLLGEWSHKNNKKPSEISFGSNHICKWICPDCGSEYEMSAIARTSGKNNCPYCAGKRVNETNSLWTTHPHIAKLLKEKNLGHQITAGSDKKVCFTCPNCHYEINNKGIDKTVRFGLSCPKCSDGISYPEKFMYNALLQIGLDFNYQQSFKWSETKRYDFYIESLNLIIEIHGEQHYFKKKKSRGRTLIEEQENDKIKENLANQNSKRYIVINASKSEPNYIKENIIHSNLSNYVSFIDVDWEKCHEYACNSLIKKACELKNEGLSVLEISKLIKLSKNTIITYLKQGSEVGWCIYDPKEEMRKNGFKNGKRLGKELVRLTLNDEYIDTFISVEDADRKLSVCSRNISAVCRNLRNTAGGYKWMYKEDYDQYIKQAK